jgi:opacity protein-like surface antigen
MKREEPMITKQWIAAMLGAAAMLASFGALAQKQGETGWYAGGSLGQADLGPDDDIALKVFGGYQINRTFSVEFGYTDLGDVSVRGTTIEANALELIGVARLPLSDRRFSLYGLLGLAKVEVESSVSGFRVSDDSTELTIGLGMQYDVSPQLGVRGQWQRYDSDPEIDVLSVGFVYKF